MHQLFLVSFVNLQMHIVIIFVLITSVVVYFCSRLPADPKYLDVLKTRVHSILCRYLNLITDYYFGSSSLQLLGQSECKRLKLLGEQELWPAVPCQKLGSSCSLCSPCSNAHEHNVKFTCNILTKKPVHFLILHK